MITGIVMQNIYGDFLKYLYVKKLSFAKYSNHAHLLFLVVNKLFF